jgi:hypothetical protein
LRIAGLYQLLQSGRVMRLDRHRPKVTTPAHPMHRQPRKPKSRARRHSTRGDKTSGDRYPKIQSWPQSGEIIGEHSAHIGGGGDVKGLGTTLVVLAIVVAAVLAIGVLWQGRH